MFGAGVGVAALALDGEPEGGREFQPGAEAEAPGAAFREREPAPRG